MLKVHSHYLVVEIDTTIRTHLHYLLYWANMVNLYTTKEIAIIPMISLNLNERNKKIYFI